MPSHSNPRHNNQLCSDGVSFADSEGTMFNLYVQYNGMWLGCSSCTLQYALGSASDPILSPTPPSPSPSPSPIFRPPPSVAFSGAMQFQLPQLSKIVDRHLVMLASFALRGQHMISCKEVKSFQASAKQY